MPVFVICKDKLLKESECIKMMNNYSQSTIQKFEDLKKFDNSIATVIACFAREKCVFCRLYNKCSEARKRNAINSTDVDCCENFCIDHDLCRMTVLRALKDHPENLEYMLTCETISEFQ